MKRWTVFLIALTAAHSFGARPILAQGHGGGAGGQHGGGAGGGHGASSTHDNAGTKSASGKETSGGGMTVTQHLTKNTKLASKLQSLLPPNTDLTKAADGFKNLGRFVAAVHVANNLGISFDDLKKAMMGPPTESLGKAIHTLKPDVDAKAETKKADKQAKDDIEESEKG